MESFDRRYYESEVLRDGRRVFGQVLIGLDLCTSCQCPIVQRMRPWILAGLFSSTLTLDRQMRRAGWRYRYKDTDECEACAALRVGFKCALCGMDRSLGQVAYTIGGAAGWQDRICTSCDETQPVIVLQRKINELRTRHAELEDDESAEEPEPDMDGSAGDIAGDGEAGG